jgi:hypothetical protein
MVLRQEAIVVEDQNQQRELRGDLVYLMSQGRRVLGGKRR